MGLNLDLLVPKGWDKVSGGNFYNLDLVENLASMGCKTHWLPYDKDITDYSPNPGSEFVLIDSILSHLWNVQNLSIPCIGLIHLPQSFVQDKNFSADLLAKELIFFSKLDACIFVSENTRCHTIDFFEFTGSSCVIEPGRPQKIEINKKFSKDQSTLNLLNVGRLDKNKNQASIIDMLSSFSMDFPQQAWTMTFCGPEIDNYYQCKMYPKIIEYGFEERIKWLGALPRNKLSYLYADADCYICSSKYESWGIAIMEAMGSGLAVFNCAEGGAKQLTELAKGFQINSHRDFSHFLGCLSDPKKLEEAKRKSLSGFEMLATWPQQAQKMLKWLQQLKKRKQIQ
ncbi:MAG: glycosyltransferase family 4 protein [Oligoflexales bacterium]